MTGTVRVIAPPPEWTAGLSLKRDGHSVEATSGNATIILQRDPAWVGLRFDEFRGEPALVSPAPRVMGFDPPRVGPLDDYSISYIGQWFAASVYRMKLSKEAVATAALVGSKAVGRSYHPVREYLEGLTWDGVRRLETWLATYAGATDGEYQRQVGRLWMIAAVARVMKRVSICKTMIILEGNQDAGKSTLLRRLCPREEWFSDTPIDLSGGADKYQALRGKWIVEIPELDGFKGKEATRIKSFVSSPVDNYRRSYGAKNEDVPRQCVFAGTTNEDHYLHDGTGNVRFWPVRVGKVDLDGIERDRDQLWAEALSEYMEGKQWHISDARLAALAREEQAAREDEDVWTAAVSVWVRDPTKWHMIRSGVNTADVLKDAIGMQTEKQDRGAQSRVGGILKKMGFVEKPGRNRPRLYMLKREDEEESDE